MLSERLEGRKGRETWGKKEKEEGEEEGKGGRKDTRQAEATGKREYSALNSEEASRRGDGVEGVF